MVNTLWHVLLQGYLTALQLYTSRGDSTCKKASNSPVSPPRVSSGHRSTNSHVCYDCYTNHGNRGAVSWIRDNDTNKSARTLTLCLRAWFLLLKNKISFFLMTWFLKGNSRQKSKCFYFGREVSTKSCF